MIHQRNWLGAVALVMAAFPAQAQEPTFTIVEHAGFVIDYEGTRFCIDPGNRGNWTPYNGTCDAVLATHKHDDHWKTLVANALGGDIYRPFPIPFSPKTFSTDANGYDTLTIEGYTVKAVPAYNTNCVLCHHSIGSSVGYVLYLGDTVIYIAGDTDVLELVSDVDYVFVPLRPPYTFGYQEAAQQTILLDPVVAIPYHWGDTQGDDPNDYANALIGTGITVEIWDWYPDNGFWF